MKKPGFSLMIGVVLVATSALAFAPAKYEIKQKYVLGGEGGWDYLTYDPAGKRLFISRGTHVMVVDPAKGSVVGDIPDTAGVHGIALAQDLGKGFTSNGRENSVTVFDLKTLKPSTKIKIKARTRTRSCTTLPPIGSSLSTAAASNATVIDAAKGTWWPPSRWMASRSSPPLTAKACLRQYRGQERADGDRREERESGQKLAAGAV